MLAAAVLYCVTVDPPIPRSGLYAGGGGAVDAVISLGAGGAGAAAGGRGAIGGGGGGFALCGGLPDAITVEGTGGEASLDGCDQRCDGSLSRYTPIIAMTEWFERLS
jgi:hypothetical protein